MKVYVVVESTHNGCTVESVCATLAIAEQEANALNSRPNPGYERDYQIEEHEVIE